MTETSPRLGLPLLAAGQAQKHITHNEALVALDALTQLSVVGTLSTPPGSPAANARYIIGSSPTGAWAGKATQVAAYQEGTWVYYVPKTGWRAHAEDVGYTYVFHGTAWVGDLSNIPAIGVNATANSTTKFIAKSDTSLFDTVGGSARVNVNKTGTSDTASFIFQKAYSGRAEFGLLGVDTFGLKVSADGSTWKDSVAVDSAGCVSFPQGVALAIGRNVIINGGFDIWQRGTSFTQSNAYHADRWSQSDAGGYTATITQQVTGNTEWAAGIRSKYFLRIVKNNAVASAIMQKVEDLQQFSGGTYYLSFWLKSSTTTTVPGLVGYTVLDGTTLSSQATITSVQAPTLSSSWQKYIYKVVFTTFASLSGAHHFRLQLLNAATANTYDIAEVQLERGAGATEFERRSIAQELRFCQRYYEKSFPQGTAPAQNAGTTGCLEAPVITAGAVAALWGKASFKVTKRTTPTITFYNTSAANAFVRNATRATDATATSASSTGDNGFSINATGLAGWVAGDAARVHWAADAEL